MCVSGEVFENGTEKGMNVDPVGGRGVNSDGGKKEEVGTPCETAMAIEAIVVILEQEHAVTVLRGVGDRAPFGRNNPRRST